MSKQAMSIDIPEFVATDYVAPPTAVLLKSKFNSLLDELRSN
jgi:hypothetical protein